MTWFIHFENAPLKLISSPYYADSGFVFVFVLNSLKCYTSVTAYIKFFSPPLRFISFKNSRWAETSVWNSVKVPLLVIICSARISGVNNEEKGKFVAEFLVLLVNIPSCWAPINIAAEIAQYGLEFIFKLKLCCMCIKSKNLKITYYFENSCKLKSLFCDFEKITFWEH